MGEGYRWEQPCEYFSYSQFYATSRTWDNCQAWYGKKGQLGLTGGHMGYFYKIAMIFLIVLLMTQNLILYLKLQKTIINYN